MLTRRRVPELMDDPALDPVAHKHALIGLDRLNALGRVTNLLLSPLNELIQEHKLSELRILDVATGSGTGPISLWTRARLMGLTLHIAGCDISDVAVTVAKENALNAGASVDFFTLNVLEEDLPRDYDVIMTSLFTHHLSEDEVVRLMVQMKSASKKMVLINDLERSALNYALVWLGTRVVTHSPVVHFDGPASVRNAFTAKELMHLAARAGLDGAVISATNPCRMMLTWKKQ